MDWGANPLDASTVKVYNERVVQQRFGSIAERMAWSIETYYRELCNPTPGFHTQNVKYAMELTSGTLRMFGSSLENCTAPDEAIEEMFVGVRDFMGEIAKSQILISEDRAWEIKGHAGALIAETLRRVGCNRQRIVA